MKLLKALLIILAMTLFANAKWKTLKPLHEYPGNSFYLDESVAYMEIRWYDVQTRQRAKRTLALYRKPLSSYPKEVIAKFKSLKPKYSKNADIENATGNAFFIDSSGKMFQMDMKKDIIGLLGTIDTPAEVQLVMVLDHENFAKRYKKTGGSYRVQSIEPSKKCTSLERYGILHSDGRYLIEDEFNFKLLRKGCERRAHTRFVKTGKNYERYTAIVSDKKGNLYLTGNVGNSGDICVLDKYNSSGKKLWSHKLKACADKLIIKNGLIYAVDTFGKKLRAVYSFAGRKKPVVNGSGISLERKKMKAAKYSPEGLPNKQEAIVFQMSDYARGKNGDLYLAGSEIFYPSGAPDEIPDGECGNIEQVSGAVVARLDKHGRTIWAKVMDRNE